MAKVVIKILQVSAVTQTVLGGLTVYPPVASIVQCIMCQKLWMSAGSKQSCCNNNRAYFFYPPGTLSVENNVAP